MRAVFVNVDDMKTSPYVNPLVLQSFAAALAVEAPEADVVVMDLAAGDDLSAVPELSSHDALVLAVPSSRQLDRAAGLVPATDCAVVVCGEVVTELGQEVVTRILDERLEPGRVSVFAGREASWLPALVRRNGQDGAGASSPTGRGTADSQGGRLPREIAAAPVGFSSAMASAVHARGMFVLVEGLSRGCEHHCLYCHLMNSPLTRGVVQDIRTDGDHLWPTIEDFQDSAMIYFADENFFGGHGPEAAVARAEAIVGLSERLMSARTLARIGVDTRVDTLSPGSWRPDVGAARSKAWDSLQEAGLAYVYFGIESFSRTQLNRYGKGSQWEHIDPAIHEARSRNLAFTIGLILLDQLATASEIEESLAKIQRDELYGHVASPLKAMRLSPKTSYTRSLNHRGLPGLGVSGPSLPWEASFADASVARAWGRVSPVHQAMVAAGYRHSDVAAYLSMLEPAPTVAGIAEAVARTEIAILEGALAIRSDDDYSSGVERRLTELLRTARPWLDAQDRCARTPLQRKVVRYLAGVFARLESAGVDWRTLPGTV